MPRTMIHRMHALKITVHCKKVFFYCDSCTNSFPHMKVFTYPVHKLGIIAITICVGVHTYMYLCVEKPTFQNTQKLLKTILYINIHLYMYMHIKNFPGIVHVI